MVDRIDKSGDDKLRKGYKELLSNKDKLFNLRIQLQDSRDDLITLLGAVNQALRAIDLDNMELKSRTEIGVLRNGANYLTEKYGVKKFVQ